MAAPDIRNGKAPKNASTSQQAAARRKPSLVAADERAPRVAMISAPPANAVSPADAKKVSARAVSSNPKATSAGAIIDSARKASAQPRIDRTYAKDIEIGWVYGGWI